MDYKTLLLLKRNVHYKMSDKQLAALEEFERVSNENKSKNFSKVKKQFGRKKNV